MRRQFTHVPVARPIGRGAFLRGVGAAAFAGAVALGGSGVGRVHASDNPSIDDSNPAYIIVYPTNDQSVLTGETLDLKNVQCAIDNVTPGGTVLLKATNLSGAQTQFYFGDKSGAAGDNIRVLVVNKDLTLQGEALTRNAGGWIETGTKIWGGNQARCGSQVPVSITVRDIIFERWTAGAFHIKLTKGYNEFSGCSFKNYLKGIVYSGTVNGAFPWVLDGGTGNANTNGRMVIRNNFIGKPPMNMMNNLSHFNNCNLDLEITNNYVEDCTWSAFVVWANSGTTTIAGNTINKSLSFQEGAAIIVGGFPKNYYAKSTYNNSATVANNTLTVSSANSSGIFIGAYPPSQHPIPAGVTPTFLVSGNKIHMNNSLRAAISCLGACTNTTISNNKVTGSAEYGVCVARYEPLFAQPSDAGPSLNSFIANDFSGLKANYAIVYVDGDAQTNHFTKNVFGSVELANAVAGVVCEGGQNQFVDNDFRGSGIPGWLMAPYNVGCVYLGESSHDNEVFESGNFPPGSGGAYHQCWDEGANNRVVGLRANETSDPGIGDLVKQRNAVAKAEIQQAVDSFKTDDNWLRMGLD